MLCCTCSKREGETKVKWLGEGETCFCPSLGREREERREEKRREEKGNG